MPKLKELELNFDLKFGFAAFNSEVQHMSPKLHWAFGN